MTHGVYSPAVNSRRPLAIDQRKPKLELKPRPNPPLGIQLQLHLSPLTPTPTLSRDAHGNQQLFGGEPWVSTLTGPMPQSECLAVRIDDKGDGIYLCSASPQLAGEYIMAVTLHDRHARRSPLRISVAPAEVHPQSCVALGAGLHSGRKGFITTFRVIACDAYGNQCTGFYSFGVRVKPPLSAPRAPPPVVSICSQGNGATTYEFIPMDSGRHLIAVTLDGTPINGSDFSCHVAM